MENQHNNNGEQHNEPLPMADAPHRAPETFHFSSSRMHDSIWVQKHHNYVNDDEEHEEYPHLQDFLHPHHLAHIETLYDGVDGPTIQKEDGKIPLVVVPTKKPTLARPSRSILHKADCETRKECKITMAKQQHVSFGQVTVRDYDMILGDHPSCTYGPPVTIDWDYLEYEPLAVNEYEIHHARRRPLRSMMLNYYKRKDILTQAGYSSESIKAATRKTEKVKRQRAITRQFLPVSKAEDMIESAGRKLKKAFKRKESVVSE